jgi:hypothetical protein
MAGPSDEEEKKKKGTLDDLKNVIQDFGKEIGDALATNISVDNITEKLLEVDIAAKEIAKSFGLGSANIVNLKEAMTAAVTEVTLLGGSFADVAKIQQEVGISLGRNVTLASESYAGLFASAQVSGQQVDKFLPKFKEIGISTYQAGKEMEKVVNSAREIGVNAQAVAADVVTHMDKINKYNFSNGVEGLARMAAHATAINMDMADTFKFAEKVFNPEGAIETAAALQRLGVTQSQLLDPLRLMDLSQNDPEELQRQMAGMAKSFVELNEKGRFQIAPGSQRRLREIAEAMGMSYEQLSKMAIGAKELDDKMQKIRFPDAIKEEDRNFIANLAEMNDKGEYVIQYKGQEVEVNKLMDKFQGDQKAFQEFMKENEPKSMEELAKEQLHALKAIQANIGAVEGREGYAIAGSELGGQMIEAITKGYEKTVEVFDGLDIRTLREHYEKNGAAVLDSVNKVLTGEGSVADVFSALGTTITSTKDLFEGAFKTAIESAKTSTEAMGTSQNKFVELLTNSMEGFKNAAAKAEGFANQTTTTDGNTSTNQNAATNPNLNQVNNTTMGGANTTAQQAPMTTNSNSTISMNIKLDAPPNIDTAQLQKILQDPMFQQELIKAIQIAQSNNGLTPAGNPMDKKR